MNLTSMQQRFINKHCGVKASLTLPSLLGEHYCKYLISFQEFPNFSNKESTQAGITLAKFQSTFEGMILASFEKASCIPCGTKLGIERALQAIIRFLHKRGNELVM